MTIYLYRNNYYQIYGDYAFGWAAKLTEITCEIIH